MSRTAFIFGYGFIGRAFAAAARQAGYAIRATARDEDKRAQLAAQGVEAVDPGDVFALRRACEADLILITPAPTDDGCPAFAAIGDWANGPWIGYLSTTGVYGDLNGGWAFEETPLRPTAPEGARRVRAEAQWLSRGAHVFRLPGLYGPGRNVIERLRDASARRIHKPGHVFSRLHHDDCAAALIASTARPRPGGIYNLCDDEPAAADAVLDYAAALTGLPSPPAIPWDDPALSPGARRFYRDNRRVANARAKAELGWRPAYPTYREGLRALFENLTPR